MIEYRSSIGSVNADNLRGGFFAGWLDPPSPETHMRVLVGSAQVVLATDTATANVIGFITAVTDGVLAGYIPFLEVLSGYQFRGIGSELVRRMLADLSGYYMIDLLCDGHIQPWYERLGLRRASGMMARHYERQSGE
jgi:ribosomal protein S18 acetylase RimI-like enzyme